jgi:hypothetical protein
LSSKPTNKKEKVMITTLTPMEYLWYIEIWALLAVVSMLSMFVTLITSGHGEEPKSIKKTTAEGKYMALAFILFLFCGAILLSNGKYVAAQDHHVFQVDPTTETIELLELGEVYVKVGSPGIHTVPREQRRFARQTSVNPMIPYIYRVSPDAARHIVAHNMSASFDGQLNRIVLEAATEYGIAANPNGVVWTHEILLGKIAPALQQRFGTEIASGIEITFFP